jgi:hypothetical protein
MTLLLPWRGSGTKPFRQLQRYLNHQPLLGVVDKRRAY